MHVLMPMTHDPTILDAIYLMRSLVRKSWRRHGVTHDTFLRKVLSFKGPYSHLPYEMTYHMK